MWTENGGIFGIGYEGNTLEELVDQVQKQGATVLVDVRLNAISRKRGFSKTALAAGLEAAGITYLHRPQLGNPRENRAGYGHDAFSDVGRAARAQYSEHVGTEAGDAALEELAQLATTTRVAVLCFERSELHCHRREVLNAVRGRLDALVEA